MDDLELLKQNFHNVGLALNSGNEWKEIIETAQKRLQGCEDLITQMKTVIADNLTAYLKDVNRLENVIDYSVLSVERERQGFTFYLQLSLVPEKTVSLYDLAENVMRKLYVKTISVGSDKVNTLRLECFLPLSSPDIGQLNTDDTAEPTADHPTNETDDDAILEKLKRLVSNEEDNTLSELDYQTELSDNDIPDETYVESSKLLAEDSLLQEIRQIIQDNHLEHIRVLFPEPVELTAGMATMFVCDSDGRLSFYSVDNKDALGFGEEHQHALLEQAKAGLKAVLSTGQNKTEKESNTKEEEQDDTIEKNVIREYLDGVPIKTLKDEYAISDARLYKILHKNNIQLRTYK